MSGTERQWTPVIDGSWHSATEPRNRALWGANSTNRKQKCADCRRQHWTLWHRIKRRYIVRIWLVIEYFDYRFLLILRNFQLLYLTDSSIEYIKSSSKFIHHGIWKYFLNLLSLKYISTPAYSTQLEVNRLNPIFRPQKILVFSISRILHFISNYNFSLSL